MTPAELAQIRARAKRWSGACVPVSAVIIKEWSRAQDDRLALVREVDGIRAAVGAVLEAGGCSCPCDHHYTEHEPDCARCVGCRIAEAIR